MERILSPASAGFSDVDYQKDTFSFFIHNFRLYLLGAVLHSVYNGIENILKQILKEQRFEIPDGTFWHRDLLDVAVNSGVISRAVFEHTKEYMAFRHYFAHAYALNLKPERMRPLVESASQLIQDFKLDLIRNGIVLGAVKKSE